jgi:hypothetical protein
MLFCSLLDFGMGFIIAAMCPFDGIYPPSFGLPWFAVLVPAWFRLLMVDLAVARYLRLIQGFLRTLGSLLLLALTLLPLAIL